jgi:Ca2+-binding RTX toxin-like protein
MPRRGRYTSDQTNYEAGYARAQVQDFESVIATGLGAIDYLAAGANDPELLFANQQNFLGFMGAVDLRGTHGSNTLYASGGNYGDVLEGRGGDDNLSGGDGNDDFIFGTADGCRFDRRRRGRHPPPDRRQRRQHLGHGR